MPLAPHRARTATVLLLAACAAALAGCGSGDEPKPKAAKVKPAAPQAEPESAAPPKLAASNLPAPVAIDAAEVDTDALNDAATTFAEEHPDQVGDQPVDGPLEESVKATTWGDHDYAYAAFDSGSELDEVALLYRRHGAADEPWTVARWIEAGDVSGTCLLPRPLALLWFPEVAKGPGCAIAPRPFVGQHANTLVRTFDGGVVCEAAATIEGVELKCRQEVPDDTGMVATAFFGAGPPVLGRHPTEPQDPAEQLATATLGWGESVNLGTITCTSRPTALSCIRKGVGFSMAPLGDARKVDGEP